MMGNPTSAIKNLIVSHLRGTLFGMNVYGCQKIDMGDRCAYIEISAPSRFEVYGQVVVYHPDHGKWVGSVTCAKFPEVGVWLRGTPRQAMSADEIKAAIGAVLSLADYLYEVYGVPRPAEAAPISWDPYWN